VLELGAALRWFWFRKGRLSEGAEWYSEILALPAPLPETEQLGHVLAAAALGPFRQGKVGDAERLQMRALALWRKLGNHYELARSLSQLGNQYRHTARPAEAYRCFDEGIRLSEERDFRMIECLNRIGLAETMYDDERCAEALVQAGRALDIVERLGYALGLPWGQARRRSDALRAWCAATCQALARREPHVRPASGRTRLVVG
jgi:tetratricopeptide (TPR) repeat protein